MSLLAEFKYICVKNASDYPLDDAVVTVGFIVLDGTNSHLWGEKTEALSTVYKDRPLQFARDWPPESSKHLVVFGKLERDGDRTPFAHQIQLIPYDRLAVWAVHRDISNVGTEDPLRIEQQFIRKKLEVRGFKFAPGLPVTNFINSSGPKSHE